MQEVPVVTGAVTPADTTEAINTVLDTMVKEVEEVPKKSLHDVLYGTLLEPNVGPEDKVRGKVEVTFYNGITPTVIIDGQIRVSDVNSMMRVVPKAYQLWLKPQVQDTQEDRDKKALVDAEIQETDKRMADKIARENKVNIAQRNGGVR